jgi:hypothetical protein
MYLSGLRAVGHLADWYSLLQAAQAAGIGQPAADYFANGQFIGDNPLQCVAKGGRVTTRYSSFDANGRGLPPVSFGCALPAVASGSSGPVYITNTNENSVLTTVSPQISPIFVQQQQPENSPVNAAAQQVAPAPQSVGPSPITESRTSAPNTEFQEYLELMRAENAAREEREQSFYDTIAKSLAPNSPVASVAPEPQVVYAGSVGPTGYGEPETAPVAGPTKLEQYTPLIVFASALIGLAAVLKRSKSRRR